MSTWRAIAYELGRRLENHARCPDHSIDEADPHGCPFCRDREVYNDWYQKETATLRRDRQRLRK